MGPSVLQHEPDGILPGIGKLETAFEDRWVSKQRRMPQRLPSLSAKQPARGTAAGKPIAQARQTSANCYLPSKSTDSRERHLSTERMGECAQGVGLHIRPPNFDRSRQPRPHFWPAARRCGLAPSAPALSDGFHRLRFSLSAKHLSNSFFATLVPW